MNFTYPNLIPIFVLIFLVFAYFVNNYRKKYFGLVERFFFRKMSKISLLSFVIYLTAFFFLLFSLADLRGKAQKIESSIPDQKTIIVIDASASMLVEDVRPNRFKKSLMMARHFVKRSAGHQISVVMFSDSQRKLIPFTDDIDLLDAKIAGLEDLNISRGGSNISLAIKESVQYFIQDSSDKEISSGNILVFTDSEENEVTEAISIPDSVNLAIVGVGTLNGGPIPMRSKNGGFRGYKKFNGEKVNSKLDENFLKSLEGQIKNYKYWIVQSYNLPTEKILSFFRKSFESKLSKGNSIIKPVKINMFLIPFVVLIFIAGVLKQFPSLRPLCLLFFILPLHDSQAKEEKKVPEHIIKLENKIKKGKSTNKDYLNLAQEYLSNGFSKKSNLLYDERLNFDTASNKELINYGTSLLRSNKVQEGVEFLSHISSNRKLSKEESEIVSKNILKALVRMEEKNKKKKKNKDEKKKDQKKDQKKKQDQKQGNSGKDNKQSKSSEKQKKPKDSKDENEKEKKKGDKKKEQDEKNSEEQKKKPKSVKDRENEIKKKRKMTKIPAALKQVLDDDRKLQKRKLERIRNSKSNDRTKKDW